MRDAPPMWATWVALSAALVGCDGSSSTTRASRDAAAAADGSPIGPRIDFSGIRCEPTIDSLRRDVFGKACSWDSCHGNNPAWGLWLLSPDVSTELVDASAASCKGWERVVPGSPERSLLWHKLSDPKPPCGDQMPLRLGPLPDRVKACVKGWIEALATDGARPGSDASRDAPGG